MPTFELDRTTIPQFTPHQPDRTGQFTPVEEITPEDHHEESVGASAADLDAFAITDEDDEAVPAPEPTKFTEDLGRVVMPAGVSVAPPADHTEAMPAAAKDAPAPEPAAAEQAEVPPVAEVAPVDVDELLDAIEVPPAADGWRVNPTAVSEERPEEPSAEDHAAEVPASGEFADDNTAEDSPAPTPDGGSGGGSDNGGDEPPVPPTGGDEAPDPDPDENGENGDNRDIDIGGTRDIDIEERGWEEPVPAEVSLPFGIANELFERVGSEMGDFAQPPRTPEDFRNHAIFSMAALAEVEHAAIIEDNALTKADTAHAVTGSELKQAEHDVNSYQGTSIPINKAVASYIERFDSELGEMEYVVKVQPEIPAPDFVDAALPLAEMIRRNALHEAMLEHPIEFIWESSRAHEVKIMYDAEIHALSELTDEQIELAVHFLRNTVVRAAMARKNYRVLERLLPLE
ncbi:MAG TPA: hypothetical protein VGO07_04095 [Candidatus Saccharimonadales bacterium]|nr:hypothetical protein [Candidatus Saccharimonadales bacterium]